MPLQGWITYERRYVLCQSLSEAQIQCGSHASSHVVRNLVNTEDGLCALRCPISNQHQPSMATCLSSKYDPGEGSRYADLAGLRVEVPTLCNR